jgi:hypothetical protein
MNFPRRKRSCKTDACDFGHGKITKRVGQRNKKTVQHSKRLLTLFSLESYEQILYRKLHSIIGLHQYPSLFLTIKASSMDHYPNIFHQWNSQNP